MPDKAPSTKETNKTTSQHQRRADQPAQQSLVALTEVSSPLDLQRAIADPRAASPRDILTLQRLAGNRAVSRLIQAKLTVGPAGDKYEQEADRVADQVVSGQPQVNSGQLSAVSRQAEEEEEVQTKPLAASITPLVQRQAEEQEEIQTFPSPSGRGGRGEGEIQRRADGGFEAGPDVESRLAAHKGGGNPLPDDVRATMEPRFGADFGGVRIHTGGEADQLNRQLSAQAFTHGQDIYMRAGKYAPGTPAGNRLLAHELTHVVQQSPATGQRNRAADPGAPYPKRDHTAETSMPTLHRIEGRRVQRSFLGGVVRLVDFLNLLAPIREWLMSRKYGKEIKGGPLGGLFGWVLPFSHGMLNKIDKVLSQIPQSHVKGNPELKAISGSEGLLGGASAYGYETQTIQMQRPLRIFMPPWLYIMLDKGDEWQRKQMDNGFLAGLAGGDQNPAWLKDQDVRQVLTDLHKDISGAKPDLQIMGGGQGALLENLVEWTIRHEVGHSVDKKIHWKERYSGLPECGGWEVYETFDELSFVAERFLRKAGMDEANFSKPADPDLGHTIATKLRDYLSVKDPRDKPDEIDRTFFRNIWTRNFSGVAEEALTPIREQLKNAITFARVAMAQPWMLGNGGGDAVTWLDRMYQIDEYNHWCSYLTEARHYALSNYQFAAVDEWFAEAYAAYYGKPEQKAKLSAAARQWFDDNVHNK